MGAGSAPWSPLPVRDAEKPLGYVIYMVTHALTGASQGTLGAGLGTQDWLLCVDAPGLEL